MQNSYPLEARQEPGRAISAPIVRARHGTACKKAAQYIDATIQDRIDSDTTPLRRSGTGARVWHRSHTV